MRGRKLLFLLLALLVYLGIVVAAFTLNAVDPRVANADTWNHREYATIAKNSPAKSKFVQGATYDGKRYAYVVKQNQSKHQSLWRVDMEHPTKPTKLRLRGNAASKIHHGNDLQYVMVGKTKYLLVAPCKTKSKYLVVLKVSGNDVAYVRSIRIPFTQKVSAITTMTQNGSKLHVITGYGKHLWCATIDLRTGKVKKLGRVHGYVSNQGITYSSGSLYACDGGYTTRLGHVRKYSMTKRNGDWYLKRVWVRDIKGEPETAFVDRHGKVCVAVEGKWHYNYGDRIVRWVR